MNFTIWNVINFAFLALGAFIALMGVPVLLHSGKWRLLPNRLLSIYLVCMGIVFGMTFLIQTGLIIRIYWLFRLPSPLYYIMFPAGFLYVKTLLRDRNKLAKTDYLHFIPAVLHFFELLPYYLKSREYKINHIAESLKDTFGSFAHSEGWLPPYMHNIIRGMMGAIYGALIVYIIIKFRARHPDLKKLYPGLFRWLMVFGSMMLAFGVIVSYSLIFGRTFDPKRQLNVLIISYATTQIITGFVLFLYPAYLYGMPRLLQKQNSNNDIITVEGAGNPETGSISAGLREIPAEREEEISQLESFTSEEALLIEIYQAYKERLETLMKEKQPYLQEHYKVADLARDLGIPQHHVTILLNRILNTRFNDYINHYRIQHIKVLIQKHGLTHTLEGFANMAGFSNRTTFIRAVQRVTGQSPSKYFLSDKN